MKRKMSMTDQQERALRAGLKALADTSRGASASPRVEAAVLEEAGRLKPASTVTVPATVEAGFSRPSTRPSIGPFIYLAAAALVVVSLSGAWVAHRLDRAPDSLIRPAGFVEIPGAWALPPIESGAIVRVALPVAALPQYGLPIQPDSATHSIDVDLLIAQDGIPRAIRLAPEATSRSTP